MQADVDDAAAGALFVDHDQLVWRAVSAMARLAFDSVLPHAQLQHPAQVSEATAARLPRPRPFATGAGGFDGRQMEAEETTPTNSTRSISSRSSRKASSKIASNATAV